VSRPTRRSSTPANNGPAPPPREVAPQELARDIGASNCLSSLAADAGPASIRMSVAAMSARVILLSLRSRPGYRSGFFPGLRSGPRTWKS
jgi:hypothetical protein